MQKVIHRRSTCRGCDGHNLSLVLSLKPSPIGDAYVTVAQADVPQPSYPIDLYMCDDCGLAQLIDVIDPDILYGQYIYLTESSVGLSSHFQSYARTVVDRCKLHPRSMIVDIGSNDGTLLRYFQRLGMNVLGVEPAVHIAAQASASGIETVDRYFTPDVALQIFQSYGPAKLITANNVLANIDDLISWIHGINTLLAADGVFVFESYYLADVIQNMVFDFIYHEHLSAFSVRPMIALFERIGLELVAVERIATKGGSLRYFVQRSGGPIEKDGSVIQALAFEEQIGLYRPTTFKTFENKIELLKEETKQFLANAKSEGKSIAGFGASITGTTLIYHFEIGEYIDYLIDDNLAKQGRLSPGHHLPVFPSSVLCERKPDYVIILAWRFAQLIISKNQSYVDGGGQFLIPVPDFKL